MSRSTGRYRRRRHLVGATIAMCPVLLGSACSTTLQGQAVSVFDDPFSVAGMPATDGGEIDQLAGSAISDIEQYWENAYPETFGDYFTPVRALVSGMPPASTRSSAATAPTGWSTPASAIRTARWAGTAANCCPP